MKCHVLPTGLPAEMAQSIRARAARAGGLGCYGCAASSVQHRYGREASVVTCALRYLRAYPGGRYLKTSIGWVHAGKGPIRSVPEPPGVSASGTIVEITRRKKLGR